MLHNNTTVTGLVDHESPAIATELLSTTPLAIEQPNGSFGDTSEYSGDDPQARTPNSLDRLELHGIKELTVSCCGSLDSGIIHAIEFTAPEGLHDLLDEARCSSKDDTGVDSLPQLAEDIEEFCLDVL